MHYLLKKATIVDASSPYHGKKKDILIQDGKITKIGSQLDAKNAQLVEIPDGMLSIGWMDLFSNLCDPGEEHKENITTGSQAAAAGGYTDICLIPNTQPVLDSKMNIEYVRQASGLVNLHPIGALSKQTAGQDLAEMYDMKLSGAIAFSDGKNSVQESGLMLKALQYVKAFDGVIIQLPEDKSIAQFGLMHEGETSTQLGMAGKPEIAESLQIKRDIELAEYTDSKIHFTGVSSKKSIDLIRQAKKQGLKVSCSVTPFHLVYTDKSLHTYDSTFKVNPPLRSESDRKALLKAVEDGTIDSIASHHFPQDWDAKQCEFEYAKAGMIGFQTVLPLLLQASPSIPIERWIEMLTTTPRNLMDIEIPSIKEGEMACLTLFSTSASWHFDATTNKSKSNNSPLFNKTLQGKVKAIFNNQQACIYE